jgi:hypothetical protein
MARRPKQRREYGTEIMALAKMSRVVSLDSTRPAEWRVRVLQHLNAASEAFQADQTRVAGEPAEPRGR